MRVFTKSDVWLGVCHYQGNDVTVTLFMEARNVFSFFHFFLSNLCFPRLFFDTVNSNLGNDHHLSWLFRTMWWSASSVKGCTFFLCFISDFIMRYASVRFITNFLGSLTSIVCQRSTDDNMDLTAGLCVTGSIPARNKYIFVWATST